jgi:coenzyme F420-dependent glucose-6-phosphate dehydrogenase
VNRPPEVLRRVVDAFREGGGEGKPVRLQYHLAWAPTDAEAEAHALDQWRHAGVDNKLLWDLDLPEELDAATASVRAEDLRGAVPISADPAWHAERIATCAALGFEAVMLHNVGPNQREFIDVFGAKVLPELQAP